MIPELATAGIIGYYSANTRMLTLSSPRLTETSLPLGTSWLLAACMEAKGKQDLWTQQKLEVLAVLRERAMIQSVESSNRIEGVTVPANRLRPVVLGKARRVHSG